ncbi:hypothetical protein BDR03DRAFT_986967 [Suillus americanus]|nr:hypothetical protein BDR03DRAFT_986967 [Suillus americanus]
MTLENEDEEFSYSRFKDQSILIAKYPARKNQDIQEIMERHTCPGFQHNLTYFVNSFNNNNIAGGRLRNASLPFSSLDVYHGFRFSLNDLGNEVDLDLGNLEIGSVKAKPKSLGSPARFDMVVVMISEDCESTGLQSARIGPLKVIFRLPTKLYGSWTAPSTWPSEPLAYVE